MIDWTKPVRMKGAKGKVEILCTDLTCLEYPVLGIVMYADGTKTEETWTLEGIYYTDENSERDLENIPEEYTAYVNCYKGRNSCGHFTKKGAIKYAQKDCIARRKITYKEGQFDD